MTVQVHPLEAATAVEQPVGAVAPARLPPPFGLLIDRSRPIAFRFCGRAYQGCEGDTLASALAANGVLLLSRSFKYHRPRGPLTMAGLDANTYVQVGDEPNVPADRLPLRDGLAAEAQNVNGTLERDRDSRLERLAPFLPVGFYYKAFYRPKGAWRFWEPLIRRKAGLGVLSPEATHDVGTHDKVYLFADVAVIGGGPAGLAAALAAAAAGAEVVLIDDGARLGGVLLHARFGADGRRGPALADELAAAVAAAGGTITVLSRAACTGWFADNWLAIVQGRRLYKLRARQVVAATGALEQPMVFRNNDLPGVMLGSAAQRLMRLYGARPGARAVVATANVRGYAVALDLLEAGVAVAAVADLRADPAPSPERDALRAAGVRVLDGHAPIEAVPGPGKRRVAGAVLDRIAGEGRTAGAPERLECDLLLTSIGYSPLAQLVCQAGGKLAYDERRATLALTDLPANAAVAGSLAGSFDLDAVLASGRRAGWQAARDAGLPVGPEPAAMAAQEPEALNHPWPIFPHPRGKDFVDFDEDQQVADLVNAVADGFDHVELAKRYTTVGMGPSQGRTSAVNALRIVHRAAGRRLDGAVLTTQRPPFLPESFAALAGKGFEPVRHTAMHARHLERGARMMPAGLWLRPAYYGAEADREAAIADEVAAVRNAVGLIDVSTLGKLEVRGPDAAEFLDRLYTFSYARQPVGRTRYVLMTDQTGAIADDGVACRLAEQHFYVTATTSGVDAVFRAMLRWNAEWRLAVDIANVTAAWAAVNAAGPRARDLLGAVGADVDLSPAAFPYLAVREGRIAGIPARLLRVGFVGELGYEIHVPASYGEALWDALLAAGDPFGLRPFGVEAQRRLRLEKAHIIVGQDTDGLTTPAEADMLWAVGRNKPFFVGQRSLAIQARRPLQRRLVGFTLPLDGPCPEECHLVIRDGAIVGRVTSAARSAACGAVVGLAYVHPEDALPGRTVSIKLDDGRLVAATVVPTPFYDPDNARQSL